MDKYCIVRRSCIAACRQRQAAGSDTPVEGRLCRNRLLQRWVIGCWRTSLVVNEADRGVPAAGICCCSTALSCFEGGGGGGGVLGRLSRPAERSLERIQRTDNICKGAEPFQPTWKLLQLRSIGRHFLVWMIVSLSARPHHRLAISVVVLILQK